MVQWRKSTRCGIAATTTTLRPGSTTSRAATMTPTPAGLSMQIAMASTGQSYLGYNMFAYCGNNPVERTDADGEFWDLIFDVVSVVTSVVEVIKNPDDPWAWAGLVGDIVDVAVPFVGGVGEVTKAVGAVSKTADLVDSAYDATKSIDNASDAIKYAQKASDAKDTAKKLHRPYIRKSTRDAVEAMAPRAADGRFLDANTGKVIDGKYDLGHKYGHEFRRERERAQKSWMDTKTI